MTESEYKKILSCSPAQNADAAVTTAEMLDRLSGTEVRV